MLSDWLTVFHTHVQSRFHVFLMICKRSVGYLSSNFCCLELWICQTFPLLGSTELRPCDRCFGPEFIAGMDCHNGYFPIHRLAWFKYSQAVLGPTHHSGGGGGQLAQILGRYVARQNQKVDP